MVRAINEDKGMPRRYRNFMACSLPLTPCGGIEAHLEGIFQPIPVGRLHQGYAFILRTKGAQRDWSDADNLPMFATT